MATLTPNDFAWMGLLEKMAVERIEGHRLIGTALTDQEKSLIGMAVSWTYGALKDMAETQVSS